MAFANFDGKSNRLLYGEITRRWQQLTITDVQQSCADRSRLIDIVQSRYGYTKSRAEKEVDLFLGEFESRLRMAA